MTTHLPVRIFQLAHITTIAGLALAITGSVEAIPTHSASAISNGITYRKVAMILLLVVYVASVGIAILTLFRIRSTWKGDRKLVCAAIASLPFLLVRVIWSLCTAFAYNSKTFNNLSPNVYAQAFMQIVMEFIIWSFFLTAGLASPSTKQAPHARGEGLEILPFGGSRWKQEANYAAQSHN
jgi:hypothetical protein